jgi:hypothetical protein
MACFTRESESARFVSRVWKCIRYLVAEEGRLCMDIAEAPGLRPAKTARDSMTGRSRS